MNGVSFEGVVQWQFGQGQNELNLLMKYLLMLSQNLNVGSRLIDQSRDVHLLELTILAPLVPVVRLEGDEYAQYDYGKLDRDSEPVP